MSISVVEKRSPGFRSAHRANITEVALMLGPLRGRGSNHVVDEEYLRRPVELGVDLWLGRYELADRVILACRSPGENWEPSHEVVAAERAVAETLAALQGSSPTGRRA